MFVPYLYKILNFGLIRIVLLRDPLYSDTFPKLHKLRDRLKSHGDLLKITVNKVEH